LGGKNSETFQAFVKLACRAYGILRREWKMFISLFNLMLCTGIPELSSKSDIEYLRRTFLCGCSDEEAAGTFEKLIYASLSSKSTQLNFFFHNLAH
jgi:phosphatidylinositol-4,5-bisphosphate 3-kinase